MRKSVARLPVLRAFAMLLLVFVLQPEASIASIQRPRADARGNAPASEVASWPKTIGELVDKLRCSDGTLCGVTEDFIGEQFPDLDAGLKVLEELIENHSVDVREIIRLLAPLKSRCRLESHQDWLETQLFSLHRRVVANPPADAIDGSPAHELRGKVVLQIADFLVMGGKYIEALEFLVAEPRAVVMKKEVAFRYLEAYIMVVLPQDLPSGGVTEKEKEQIDLASTVVSHFSGKSDISREERLRDMEWAMVEFVHLWNLHLAKRSSDPAGRYLGRDWRRLAEILSRHHSTDGKKKMKKLLKGKCYSLAGKAERPHPRRQAAETRQFHVHYHISGTPTGLDPSYMQPNWPQASAYPQPNWPQASAYPQPNWPQASAYPQPNWPQASAYPQPYNPQAPAYPQPYCTQDAGCTQPSYQANCLQVLAGQAPVQSPSFWQQAWQSVGYGYGRPDPAHTGPTADGQPTPGCFRVVHIQSDPSGNLQVVPEGSGGTKSPCPDTDDGYETPAPN